MNNLVYLETMGDVSSPEFNFLVHYNVENPDEYFSEKVEILEFYSGKKGNASKRKVYNIGNYHKSEETLKKIMDYLKGRSKMNPFIYMERIL